MGLALHPHRRPPASGSVVNGTFADTWYSRISPWVRATTAGAGATIWFIVFLSASAANTSGAGIYQLPLILGLWCSLHVVRMHRFQRLPTEPRNPEYARDSKKPAG